MTKIIPCQEAHSQYWNMKRSPIHFPLPLNIKGLLKAGIHLFLFSIPEANPRLFTTVKSKNKT